MGGRNSVFPTPWALYPLVQATQRIQRGGIGKFVTRKRACSSSRENVLSTTRRIEATAARRCLLAPYVTISHLLAPEKVQFVAICRVSLAKGGRGSPRCAKRQRALGCSARLVMPTFTDAFDLLELSCAQTGSTTSSPSFGVFISGGLPRWIVLIS